MLNYINMEYGILSIIRIQQPEVSSEGIKSSI